MKIKHNNGLKQCIENCLSHYFSHDSAELIQLTHKESKRFIAALEHPAKANKHLQQLFKKHKGK